MTERAVRVAGHFGELMQGRIGPDGPVALISLPCPVLVLEARLRPGPGLSVHGAGQRLMTPERARRFLHGLGLPLSGRVTMRATMPAGGGAGASTAALVALARLAGARLRPEALARAATGSEGASDPLMFPAAERLLWASRAGRVLDALPPLPRLDVIGGFHGPPRRTEARDKAFPDIADLIDPWRRAAAAGRAAALAELAAISAARTLALRGPEGDPTADLARQLGAAGLVIGHTGSARGLLFLPDRIPGAATQVLREAGMSGIVRFRVGGCG
ncbi:MAG: propanediol utilization protein [Rhodobacteraceae bacterium]|nr:propanediol utilization protein [Paracoccaceae bacterium]